MLPTEKGTILTMNWTTAKSTNNFIGARKKISMPRSKKPFYGISITKLGGKTFKQPETM
jgi:hypothetical protein